MLSYEFRKRADGIREEISENCEGLFCSLKCRTIRIGSYKYVPKERVYLSSKGIKIVAPSLKDENKEIALKIQTREVVKLLVHYSKSLPVIFLYTLNSCGVYIRKSLDMSDESGPGYYHPASKDDPYKRITILPETITEEVKMVLKSMFSDKVLDELNTKEANEILVKTCPKELVNATKAVTRSMAAQSPQVAKNVNTEIRQILIYPPGKGGISINTEDYMSLGRDMFLNDVIIDFFLKHLVHDVLTSHQKEKTHIFSTFFYKRLTTKPSKVNRTSNPHEWDSSLTPAQKRHARVKTWTKNVNIFEKDFIVVPINENAHWFVAIICFPSLEGCRSMIDNRIVSPQEIKKRDRKAVQIGNTTITPLTKQEQLTLNCDGDNSERDEAEAEESDLDMQCDSDEEESEKPIEKKIEINNRIPLKNEPIKQPCILIFDSLAGASRSRVVATLRDYLTCEYKAKVSTEKKFTKDNIKGVCPKIPQQNNFTDCGLYLLQYVEQFFKDPILDYTIPIKQLVSWFEEIVVTRKREEISDLLKKLMVAYSGESPQCLPEITFPTLNGKVIEEEDGETSENCKSMGKETSPEISTNTTTQVATLVTVKQLPSGEIIKRNILELGVADHVRKTIRLSTDSENRSIVQLKPDFIKKSDSEGQIYIPINMHSEFVKDVQNSLINKKICDKRHLTNNQSVSNANCIRSCDNSSDSDTNMTYLKSRRMGNKIEEHEPNKKFKKNEC